MLENKIISFSSKFNKPEKFNSQFHMVKVYVAYAGKNRNGSIISKETFEKMIPSLYGVPIVGEWKSDDYGSHGGKVEISEDGIEYIDTTKPYGFVDSSASIQWETVIEEDGTEREYITTNAFLWTSRYPEALKVLENKNNQSMEINVFSGNVSEEDEGYFEILDGEFSALCILGENVEPCFESARIAQFNLDKDKFQSEFTLMVKELKESMNFSNNNESVEGGEIVEEKIVLDDFTEEVVENQEEVIEEVQPEVEDETVEVATEEVVEEDYELKYNNLFQEFETLTSEHSGLKDNYAILETEIELLREFKATKDQEEYQAQLEKDRQDKVDYINSEFSNIPESVRDEFISKVDEYESKEDIEADICVYVVKNKVKFSKKKEESKSIKVEVETKQIELKMSPYGDLFNK